MDEQAVAILRAALAGPVPTRALRATLPNGAGIDGTLERLRRDGRVIVRGGTVHTGRLGYDRLAVAASLPPGIDVRFEPVLPSTNDAAAHRLAAIDAGRTVVVAERQTAGRGRGDRTWHSPAGGIWASVGERTTRPAGTGWVEPLAMAGAAARSLRAIGVDVRLKWPNDLVTARGTKVGGVLAESTTVGSRRERTVCGVGLNANTRTDRLPSGATSIAAAWGPVDRRAILAATVVSYLRLREDPPATVATWRGLAETIGRAVRIETPDGVRRGVVETITDAGALGLADGTTVPLGACRRLRHAED